LEKIEASSDNEVSESQSALMVTSIKKVVHSKDTRLDLFKELSFSGSLEELCKVSNI
jgi:hypothetical protein